MSKEFLCENRYNNDKNQTFFERLFMAKFSEYLKSILLIVIILQLTPLLLKGARTYYKKFTEPKTKVAVVPITEEIDSTSKYAKQFRKFIKDPEIKAIVLHIDSPGGSSGSSQALFQEINELKKEHVKPVIAFTENYCASGAYYIAAAADYIIAQPSTLVGNIGVYIGFASFQGLLDQLKVKYNTIETGKFKGAGLRYKDMTPDQRSMLQSITDDSYAQFVEDVAHQRHKLTGVSPTLWAEGKTFTGRQALKLGLVDELGPQSTLIRAIKAKAPIEGEIEWVYPPQPGILASFFERDTEFDTESRAYSWTKMWIRTLVEFLSTPLYR
jgi:signal peptide peptidase SppA